jgi:hypothetical protein
MEGIRFVHMLTRRDEVNMNFKAYMILQKSDRLPVSHVAARETYFKQYSYIYIYNVEYF